MSGCDDFHMHTDRCYRAGYADALAECRRQGSDRDEYIARILLTDLRAGLRVVYVTSPISSIFGLLAVHASRIDGATVVRTHGRECITTGDGGRLLVRSARYSHALHGLSVDVVHVDERGCARSQLAEIVTNAHIATLNSSIGSVVRHA